ncbi:Cupredoxin [Gaertneriomyces semiglobifer]|nr:Cupredoxin [Gaertneriomyces semiglobifer]
MLHVLITNYIWVVLWTIAACAPTLHRDGLDVKKFELNITEGIGSQDCFNKTIRYINGQYPGPTIELNKGDNVQVTIRNKLAAESLTIHFHGISQRGTPFYDGASHITQTPIPPGEQMTTTFSVDGHVGTYFYHAHQDLLDTTIFGPLVIHDPIDKEQFHYDEERTLMLSDFWHETSERQQAGFRNNIWLGDPDSILTNGITTHENCTDPSSNRQRYEIITVDPRKTYRFRIINAATLSFFRFEISGHNMTVIEADGTLIKPVNVDHLEINAGQRYSVLITMNQEPKDYWFLTRVMWRPNGPANGHGVLRYSTSGSTEMGVPPPVVNATVIGAPSWMEDVLVPLAAKTPIPEATTTLTYTIAQKYMPTPRGTFLLWTMGNISYALPHKPLLTSHYDGTLPWIDQQSRPQTIRGQEVVDVVLQLVAGPAGICEEHPFHLHGYQFWDLGGGPGAYDPKSSPEPSPHAILRDTATVYPYTGAHHQTPIPQGEVCGWRRIRFIADNPGIWIFHCHITFHMMEGMATAFVVDPENIPPAPTGFSVWYPPRPRPF